jgi:tetratricopeptide (TPR) repeat protein
MIDLRSLKLDLVHHRVVRPDGEESLTQLEVDALRYFVERAGDVVTREQLERDVWRIASSARSEAVPVALRRLRKKLGDGVLATVRGEGWRLAPPAPGPAAARLPAYVTPFVGREGLLREIHVRLAGAWRLVTLRGPGGVGKTRAAVEFAATWPGEVVSVSLVGLPPGDDALALLLADALGLADAGPSALRHGLRSRDRPLLVLDDADEVARQVAPLVEQLVREVPGARLLVTSRVPLGIVGEAVLEVSPFGPELARSFFVDRLRGVHPDPEREGAALDEVVALLDGLPASLEIYAGRGWFGLVPLLDELREGRQDATLDTQVERSWNSLAAPARDALLACSAFVGTFPPDAAHAASGGHLDRLVELRRRSLLQIDPGGQLFMLATVRRFCETRPGVFAARRDAQGWILAQGEAACAALVHHPGERLRELRTLRPHLLELARTGPPEASARAALVISTALAHTGPTSLRRAVLEAIDLGALAAPVADRVRLDLARTRRLVGVPVIELTPLIEGLRGAEAALLRGDNAVAVGEHGRALEAFAEAIALAPEEHWVNAVARARRCAVQALVVLRPPPDVDDDITRALGACERHGLALHLPEILRAAGNVATFRGDEASARAHLGRALLLAERFGLVRLVSDLWNALGMAWYLDDTQADACFERAVAHALARGDEAYATVFQLNLAGVRLRIDRPEDALRLLELPSQVLRNRVARQLVDLIRAGALFALGRTVDAQVTLETLEPEVIGAVCSPNAALHGALLRRLMAAELHLRELDRDPETHAPVLRTLLVDAAEERKLGTALTLRAFADRIERRLRAVEQKCSGRTPSQSGT